jgi:hypothetical protein
MTALFAMLIDDLGQIVVKVLAVAGGAAVGAFLASGLTRILILRLFRRKQPSSARTLVRVLGAACGGLVVAVLLFTGLGDGWGLGGWGLGGGQSKGDLGTARAVATQPETSIAPTPPPPASPPSVRVVMLGGNLVRNGAAYRIEGERQARTLADLQQVIRQRMAATPPAKSLDILVYENSVARGSAPVEDLEQWARQAGLTVTVVTIPGDLPP